jgi:hypothetical protein
MKGEKVKRTSHGYDAYKSRSALEEEDNKKKKSYKECSTIGTGNFKIKERHNQK